MVIKCMFPPICFIPLYLSFSYINLISHIFISAYDCKYKRVNGRLFVTKYNLFFCGKSFGVQTKV